MRRRLSPSADLDNSPEAPLLGCVDRRPVLVAALVSLAVRTDLLPPFIFLPTFNEKFRFSSKMTLWSWSFFQPGIINPFGNLRPHGLCQPESSSLAVDHRRGLKFTSARL